MKLLAVSLVVAALLAGIFGPQAFFTVDETQLAIVTRFGEIRRSISKPGLYLKAPFIEAVTHFDKRLLIFDAPPDSLLTRDKKRLIIDVYARGRIINPRLFRETLRTESQAVSRAVDIVSSELRREIASDNQAEIITTRREGIMARVKANVSPKLLEFGIEVVDVRIKRADFPDEIAESVYSRMRAERKRIADRERSEGAEIDLQVRADVDKQATILVAEATRDSDIIRGSGEADAVRIFAEALQQDPEFYAFQRSLEAYRMFLVNDATAILPADSDLLQFLQSPGKSNVSVAKTSGLNQVESAARQLAAKEYDLDAEAPTLVKLESIDWSDTSLGCPQPGMFFAQVIVPGFNLVFEHNDLTFEVHSNLDGSQLATCAS